MAAPLCRSVTCSRYSRPAAVTNDDFSTRFVHELVTARGHPRPDARPPWHDAGLTAKLAEIEALWSTVDLDPMVLARHVAARIPADAELGDHVATLHLVDLALACASAAEATAEQRAAAARAFDESYRAHLDAILARVCDGAVLVDEVRQRVYDHLLVGRGDRGPRLAEYTGRGPLLAYLRVVATRLALETRRRSDRRREEGDEVLLRAAVEDDDPELAYLKQTYHEPLRKAFAAALADLEPRARTLLRHQVIDRLSIDKVAAIYGIHRATAARQIARARQALVSGTHERLRQQLGIDEDQLQSILQLIRSEVDVSICRLLSDPTEA